MVTSDLGLKNGKLRRHFPACVLLLLVDANDHPSIAQSGDLHRQEG